MQFNGDPFTCQREKEDKKTRGFQISHLNGLFSNDIMTVKGLIYVCIKYYDTYAAVVTVDLKLVGFSIPVTRHCFDYLKPP